MPNVGTASVDLEVDGSRFGRNVRSAVQRESGGITSMFSGIGRSAGSAMSAGFSGAIHMAERLGTAVGIAGVALGGFGLKVAGDFQQTRIAFEGILGSAEKAQTFLDKLRDFAAKTPFEFPELATASKSLLAVGFNASDVIPIMTKLGNVAATLGVGGEAINGVVRALGQMKGKGKASAEELNQISEQIPGFSAVKAIAEKMGVSTAEAFKKMESGAVSADFAIEAILEGMERFPGAAGAMERQSKTLNGVISTLKDTFRDALIDGIEPFLPAISDGLVKAAPLMKTAVTGIIGALTAGGKAIAGFVHDFRSGLLEGLVDDGIGNRIGDTFRKAFEGVKMFVNALRTGMTEDEGTPIEKVALRIRTAFENVVGWVRENWPEIKGIISDTLTTVRSVIEGVVDSVQTIWANFGEQIVGWTQGHWEGVKTSISGALEFIRGITQTVTAILHADWSDAWDGIKGVFTGAWDFLTGGQEMFNSAFTGLASAGMEVAKSAFNAAWDSIKSVFDSAWDGLVEIVRGGIASIVDKILGMVGTIVHAADLAFGWIPGIGGKLGDAAAAFDSFRAEANAAIRGIDSQKTITINIVEAVSRENNVNLGTAGDPIAPESSSSGESEQLPDRAHGIDEGPLPGRLGEPMLVRAHAGEWVVTPKQMEDLTSGRSGGSMASGVGIDYDRLAAAIAANPVRAVVAASDLARGLHDKRRL